MRRPGTERGNQFHMRLSDEEQRMLYSLAERAGLSASDYLRTVIRRLEADWELERVKGPAVEKRAHR